ncbi:MAG: acyl-CoA dehydrogenase family protein [Thermoanaerobaculales bacterium]
MYEGEPATAGRSDLEAWREAASGNSFDRDPFLQHLLRRHLGPKWNEEKARLRTTAEQTGRGFDALIRECNRDENLPVVRRHDSIGQAIEEVVFHPDHHEIGRIFWGSGVLAVLADPGHEILAGAIAYLLDQNGEAGHSCPVACTAGAIKLIQRLGTDEQKRRLLPSLLETDYDRRLHAAQFVTEVQGGSDVGANACIAVPEPTRPGFYRISGEKWFCSVADAGLFVVSARLEDAPPGTRGLGLFLVPRLIDGRVNGFALRRLKYKLGTRSMPTGEVEFDGALGEPIGSVDAGFKNLVGIVLDTSRVHNALAACGIMRRALVDGHAFAHHRRAFDRRIADFPAVQEILARMRLRTMAGLATTFRVLAMSDRLDTGDKDPDLVAARRVSVMINKYWTAVAGTLCSRDGIELLGGNGTIEDFSILPRLYRDAIVLESWEGTHNTLCAQVLRDFATRGLHRPWLDHLRTEVAELAHPDLERVASLAGTLVDDVHDRISRLLGSEETAAAANIRRLVERMCRLTDWMALAAQLQWEKEYGIETDTADALELYRLTELENVDPQDTPELLDLNKRFAGKT